jgi:hypothetical protein
VAAESPTYRRRMARPADLVIAVVLICAVLVVFAHGHGDGAHSILADPVRTPGVLT